MDDSAAAASFVIFFVLVVIEIVLYGFGAAIQQLNAADIREMALGGDKKASKIERIMNKPVYYVNAIQLLTTIINLIMGWYFLSYFKRIFDKIPNVNAQFAIIFSGLLLLTIILVIGILVPKKIAVKYSKQWVLLFINAITIMLFLCRPFTAVFDVVSNVFVRLFGINPHDLASDVTEEEIISMVNEGHEQGILQESEAKMITNIFEFTDKDAKDIMTHRSNIIGIEARTSLRDAVDFMLKERNSRYPVYIDNIDHIIGIIHLKDACRMLENGKNDERSIKSIKNLIREARFIPQTRNIDTLFRSMQSLKTHMVIVIDEYGQTTGLIAMEDILEEIVGNILDEYDDEDTFIQEKGEDCYEIDGLTPLEDLGEKLDIDFSNEEFDTLNGLLVSRLEHIPLENDIFDIDYGGYNFKVLSVENKVIKNVLVTKLKEKKVMEEEGEE